MRGCYAKAGMLERRSGAWRKRILTQGEQGDNRRSNFARPSRPLDFTEKTSNL